MLVLAHLGSPAKDPNEKKRRLKKDLRDGPDDPFSGLELESPHTDASANLVQARTLAKRCENDRLDHPCQSNGPKPEDLHLLRRTTNLNSEPPISEVF
jgi:hypothetical protein